MPKISAVMALYNTPYDYLKSTIESILTQTFQDFELIIIDDASSIEYKSFMDSFNDSRIKYYKLEKNAGPGHARNEGIKKAIGDYIAIVDSDDIYYPERFKTQFDFFEQNKDISLISAAFKQSNNGKIPLVIEANEDIKTFMLFNSPFANPLVMFRREIFLKNNLFYPEDINFGEDYKLWINAMFSGIKMANLKDVLMTYTRRKGQLSKTKQDEQTSILKNLYSYIFDRLGLNPSSEEIDLHLKINNQDFKNIDISKVSSWFDKIIGQNKNNHKFEETKLIVKKEETINLVKKIHNRLLKIKIGHNNLCLSKNLKIYLEKRI